MKVAKFGGSSLANSAQFQKVKDIITSCDDRSVIVVSAPGKQNGSDHKVTDMLYLCHQLAQIDLGFQEVFSIIRERFTEICQMLELDFPLEEELKQIEELIRSRASADAVASRGEYLTAKLLANYLGYAFLDAGELFHFSGKDIDQGKTAMSIKEKVKGKVVIPGFYGSDEEGEIRTFTRGGSDISGSILAANLPCELYENWTDVSGFLKADPHIVDNPKTIPSLTYHELRELSYMGAGVLHEEAINPAREAGVPIHIRNTNIPEAHGTRIVSTPSEETAIITGVAGKKGFEVITVEKYRMSDDLSFLRKLCSVFEANGISIHHMPSTVDSISVIVSQEAMKGKEKKVLEEIAIYCDTQRISVKHDLSLLAVVGEKMAYRKGISGRIFSALAKDGVNIRMISQGAGELNILIGVRSEDFEQAVRTIYHEFLEEE